MIPSEKLTIETPEQISLEFNLAGVGSRFLAIAYDTLLQALVFVVIGLAVAFSLPHLAASWQSGEKWTIAATTLISFTLYWGYYAIFESLWKGQTPGKRMAGIRVIKDSGRPITTFEAITRNLMRAVDSLPGFYAVGLITMFLSPRNCRLGDLVAGTVVVHELIEEKIQPNWNQYGLSSPSATVPLPKATSSFSVELLSSQDLDLIETFLHRKLDLASDVREMTARRLADAMAKKLALEDPSLPQSKPEDFLELLVVQLRDTAHFRRL